MQTSENKLSAKKLEKLVSLSYSDYKKDTARFKINKNLTNSKHTVVTDTKNNDRKIIIFKGTNVFSANDLASDAALLVGLESFNNRFKNSKNFINKIKRENNGAPLTLIGHSLGAGLAEYSAGKQDKVVTLNKASGLNQLGKTINKNQTDIRSRFDLVSALSVFNKQGKDTRRKLLTKNNNLLRQLVAHTYKGLKLNTKKKI